MKNNLFRNLLFLALFTGIIYALFHYLDSKNPSLNDKAMLPDIHLRNMKKYAKDHDFTRSRLHLEKAIETMRVIESDVDIHSGDVIEKTISELESLVPFLNHEAYVPEEFNKVLSDALNALSLAEVSISETYAETNQMEKAMVALRYGKLHLNNALKFSDGELRERELHIYQEIDRLLHKEDNNAVEATFEIDHMVDELDSLLADI